MEILKMGNHQLVSEDPDTTNRVSEILADLQKNGMDAVRRYSNRFDNWNPESFELSRSEIDEVIEQLPAQLKADTDECQHNIREFARAQLETLKPLEIESQPGIFLGHRHIPLNTVGCYIPGGRYPMFGSAQMSIIPAKTAGVKNVIACTPPVKGSKYYPATVYAMHKAGADRIFILGGIPALALMTFGLADVPPADMLCGAGNKYVAEAKRQLYGRCGIDLLAGPTEILIIADDEADPALVACDLLGQAEHDPNSGVCLITLSRTFAEKALAEVEQQLKVLPTREVAEQSWRQNGIIYIATDNQEAISLSNDYAPEHLELHVENPKPYFEALTNYGSLFIGEETTVAYGDKCIGTNHILPTGCASRYTGGLWVGKFLKTVTYQRMTPQASVAIAEITERQCQAEHMLAHALTARIRIDRYKDHRDTR